MKRVRSILLLVLALVAVSATIASARSEHRTPEQAKAADRCPSLTLGRFWCRADRGRS